MLIVLQIRPKHLSFFIFGRLYRIEAIQHVQTVPALMQNLIHRHGNHPRFPNLTCDPLVVEDQGQLGTAHQTFEHVTSYRGRLGRIEIIERPQHLHSLMSSPDLVLVHPLESISPRADHPRDELLVRSLTPTPFEQDRAPCRSVRKSLRKPHGGFEPCGFTMFAHRQIPFDYPIANIVIKSHMGLTAIAGRNAMSNEIASTFDHRHYLLEVLGITVQECESILEQANGILPDLTRPLPPLYLVTTLQAGAEASASDHATYGRDMSFPRRDSPEAPALLAKLAQKVSALAPWQQDAIAYYAAGFWGGINTAAREREEMAASSDAVPPGAADN